jgi:hypothetical protein
MGREAICRCDWAGTTAEVKALLEPTELILRGDIQRRIPLTQLQQVTVQSDRLCFTVAGDPVQLFLGAAAAESWATTIKTPPPTLARKLGISSTTAVYTIGTTDDKALNAALDEAAPTSNSPDLIIACVDTPQSLHAAMHEAMPQLLRSIPIWIVYAKGPGHPLNEAFIRSHLLFIGMVDTKVVSVSAQLTALRFSLRKSS